MRSTPEDAYRLHKKAEQWQTLATEQQELAMRLRQLASDQRELVTMWNRAGTDELVRAARDVETGIRQLSAMVKSLETTALDHLATAVADEIRALRSR